MSPTEVEQFLQMVPMPTLRLTLASGDQVLVSTDDDPYVSILGLVLRGDKTQKSVTVASRMVSIPNIVMIEPVESRPGGVRRRRLR